MKDLPLRLSPICMVHKFKIGLKDNMPPLHWAVYQLSLLALEKTWKQIKYMLEHGFISPLDPPYGAPVSFMAKNDGGLRFYIDYQ